MITDIVIAAGGIGSRMSSALNPHHSKPLIEYNGEALIKLLINSAKSAGLKKFFISINKKNYQTIKSIIEPFHVFYKLKQTGPNFASVPTIFKNNLSKRFLVVCGHDYISPTQFKKLIEKAEKFDVVVSAYRNINNETSNKRRIVRAPNNKYIAVDLNADNISQDHTYVRNPYIINHDILQDVIGDNFQRSAGYFIYKRWKAHKIRIGVVGVNFPVEFDTDEEFQRFKKYLVRDKKNEIKTLFYRC